MVGRAVGIAAASWSALSSSLFNCCHTAAPSLLSASSSLALSSCGSILSSSSISSHQLGSAVCCYGTGDEKIYSSQWERYSKERQPKLLNQLEGSKQRSAIKRKKDWRSVKQATVEAGKQSREAQTDRKQCKSSAGLGLLSEDDKALYSRSDWIYQVDRVEDIQDDSFLDAVVKVYCTHSEPDYSLPWQKRRQFHSTGSGFMISGRRLLTNAHCVEHHTQVKVKRRGDDTKFVAKVYANSFHCINCQHYKLENLYAFSLKPNVQIGHATKYLKLSPMVVGRTSISFWSLMADWLLYNCPLR
ncbi:hypothetical protein O6H91_09G005100 [Diphasiastrum complanatum]|uniref:Uncharacterized protein n=2 Tax=Diphasiastrum complanatum TaxID=34168 RepID=A0ACC2CL02_DIPCM|nr:hypothetical protein O6H91_09G005100 [Diphasiastrum complanatum]KAJ7542648.1 hypothetical protein O6H91_09G005100 [Diphasiastrum complanatum]